jgi:hypothetical protein
VGRALALRSGSNRGLRDCRHGFLRPLWLAEVYFYLRSVPPDWSPCTGNVAGHLRAGQSCFFAAGQLKKSIPLFFLRAVDRMDSLSSNVTIEFSCCDVSLAWHFYILSTNLTPSKYTSYWLTSVHSKLNNNFYGFARLTMVLKRKVTSDTI